MFPRYIFIAFHVKMIVAEKIETFFKIMALHSRHIQLKAMLFILNFHDFYFYYNMCKVIWSP